MREIRTRIGAGCLVEEIRVWMCLVMNPFFSLVPDPLSIARHLLKWSLIPACIAAFFLSECSVSPRYTRSSRSRNNPETTFRGSIGDLPGEASDNGLYRKTGLASYYAAKFDGRKTASGEIFYNSLLTAAHPTLPFGTMVKVTCLANNRSVIVRINDRGPFKSKKRIIDLSQSAARKLGIIEKGVAKVSIEVVE